MRLTLPGARIRLVEAGAGADPLRANIGHHVGDDPALVAERRRALARELERPILWMNQTHSARVGLLTLADSAPVLDLGDGARAFDPEDPLAHIDADGLLIDAREWPGAPGVAVMTADCLPVLLAADEGRVVAAVHAGRRGLLDAILTRALEGFAALDAGPVHAAIGPAICGSCYEVPEEMRAESSRSRPELASTTSWGTPALDLVEGARAELARGGCVDITIDGRCTLEDVRLHSYRRDPACGRNAAIVLPA